MSDNNATFVLTPDGTIYNQETGYVCGDVDFYLNQLDEYNFKQVMEILIGNLNDSLKCNPYTKDQIVKVKNNESEDWVCRHYSHYDDARRKHCTFCDGHDSKYKNGYYTIYWDEIKPV